MRRSTRMLPPRATRLIVAVVRCAVAALWLGSSASPASVATGAVPFAPPSASGPPVVYRGATLIDGTGSPARPGMDVWVAGDRIVRVAPTPAAATADAAQAAVVVDLRGRYLLPGLIDAHVHLATPPNRRQAEAVLRRDLYGGVTAVRDMADDLRAVGDLARASLVGEIAAPDIVYAALMAGPGLFSDARTVEVSAGGLPGAVPWMQSVTDATDLPLAVARAQGTFASAIKLYADLTPELAGWITAEAHRQHMRVWAHATLYPAKPSEVVAAGVDAISHACLLVRESPGPAPGWTEPHPLPSMASFESGHDAALARLYAEMVRRGTILDATVWTYGADAIASADTPPLPPGGCDDRVGGRITGQAWRAGVAVAAGTDTVAPWTDPWPDLFHELDALSRKADMPPAAVLQAATAVGARAAGRDADMGTIEPGKLANMVVLAGDPLADLAALKSVVLTVKRGRVYPRSDFVPLQEGDIVDQ